MEAHPGASSTVSPDLASPAAASTTRSIGSPVSSAPTSMTGTSGACRESASATTWRSRPSRTTPRSRPPDRAARGRRSARPWPGRPRSTRRARRPDSDDWAACGLVALESSTQVTPSASATWAIRWPSGRKARSPSRTACWLTPWARASAAAARALATKCGAGEARSASVQSSAALVARSSMKARSTRRSSTTPTLPAAGMPRVKPTARAPSTDVGLARPCPRWRGRRGCRRRPAARRS